MAWIFPPQTPKTQEAFGYASVTLTPSGLSMEGDWRQHVAFGKGPPSKNQPETPLLVVRPKVKGFFDFFAKEKRDQNGESHLFFFSVHENMSKLEVK